MAFSTKEKLALREAIHAMKWLDGHYDGWGLEDECVILENICSNCRENEIKSNHNYLDLQYQLDSAEAEVSKLQSEIKKNKEELSDYWQVHDEQVTIIKTQTYEIKRLQNEIDIIKKRSEHNDLQDAASARQQMDIIKRLREEIKILKLGEKAALDYIQQQSTEIERLQGEMENYGDDYVCQMKSKDARIQELEDALIEQEARFQYYVQNENCESWPEARRRYPELNEKYLKIARQHLHAEGKIGPDVKPHCWQITDERILAIENAISSCVLIERYTGQDLQHETAVLRTMLREG